MPGTSSIDAVDEQTIGQIGDRDLAFADDHRGGAAAKIELGMIGRIRSRDDDRHARADGVIDHLERRFAHAQQAHLAQVVEAVFVDRGQARAMLLDRGAPLGDRLREHRVEQRDAVTALAQV